MGAIRRRTAANHAQEKAMTSEPEEAETVPGTAVPDPEPAQPDEKELLLQRRLARIEEALGLSPLT